MEAKIKHLEFIQGVINRLSTNSFLLKGWSVVLIAALFALGAENAATGYFYLALIPALLFWGLDGYFLWQERRYRKLFDKIRQTDPQSIDFSMDTSPFSKESRGWVSATFSMTLVVFHGVLIFAIAVVMCLGGNF